jgi:hypothetical protein
MIATPMSGPIRRRRPGFGWPASPSRFGRSPARAVLDSRRKSLRHQGTAGGGAAAEPARSLPQRRQKRREGSFGVPQTRQKMSPGLA